MSGQSSYGRCPSCGAEIRWCTTASGARMPLQTNPLTIMFDRGDGRYKAIRGYESHFAHCPNADQHRRDRA